MATIERIKHVAEKVRAAKRAGHDLVVVVSAMAGETNRLLGLAHEISEMPDEREKDVLLASGEQVSIALLSLALKERGQPSRSFLGHQVRIETDNAYGKARIRNIDSKRILQSLKAGEVVVVAGFQGIDEDDNITTLGRGGSDTTAVALAAFLNASADGTTDLTFTVSKADYKKALSIVEKTAPAIEAKGVDVDTDIAKVSVVGVGMRTHAGVAAKMFRVLAEEGVNIEMISTSEIKISVVIAAKYTELAVRVLHEAFIGKQGNV